MLKIRPWFFR